MRLIGCIAIAGILLLAGCATSQPSEQTSQPSEQTSQPSEQASQPSQLSEQYATAMTNCAAMASEAMPNGMQDPNGSSTVLDSNEFCVMLAAGYSREAFAELYNDPEWLANELKIWSDEGVP